jgi:hypothetical protein
VAEVRRIGLDQEMTKLLLHEWLDDRGPLNPMRRARPGTTEILLWPDDTLRADPRAMTALGTAVERPPGKLFPDDDAEVSRSSRSGPGREGPSCATSSRRALARILLQPGCQEASMVSGFEVADVREKASEVRDRVSDTVSDAYFRAIEYTRANPRNAALIALGAGIGIGCLLGRGTGRRGGGLLGSVALAAAGALFDSYLHQVE